MRSVNKVILIGNLTRDPETKQTQNSQTVVTFSIATNREWVTRDGRKQSMTEYHDLVAWAKLADICDRYLKKGKLVYVEGYLKTRSWDTPEGVKKFRTEIVVQDLIMLDKRQAGESEGEDYIPEEGGAQGGHMMEEHSSPERSEAPKVQPVKKVEETPVASKPAEAIDIDKDLGL